MGIITDNDGNVLVSISSTDELKIEEQYSPITHCLAVIKINNDYLLGWNKYRMRYEIFGGCIEQNETARECIVRECYEELGIRNADFKYIGVMQFLLKPDYFSDMERTEYGVLYGVTLSDVSIEEIEMEIKDKDEIGKVGLLSNIIDKGNIAEIDLKLTEFYL